MKVTLPPSRLRALTPSTSPETLKELLLMAVREQNPDLRASRDGGDAYDEYRQKLEVLFRRASAWT